MSSASAVSARLPRPLRVVQILPALNSGGVERGTLDLARCLAAGGHVSVVISSGGQLVPRLEAEGSGHITLPVHKKSLLSLRHVWRLRRTLHQLQPDIVHVRSRLPAWLTWLALRGLPATQRPALVSTFHGLYSVNRYSAIMGCGDRVIAISDTVQRYITSHYPQIDPGKIRLVQRGVDTTTFRPHIPPAAWQAALFERYPQLQDQRLILMPGRLSRWKGQLEFVQMLAALRAAGCFCHGVIIGAGTSATFASELEMQIRTLGLEDDITLLGHRDDIQHFYAMASLVCNLSRHPEPFGRTVIEALACGTPVLARAEGGPQEVLERCYPQGLTSSPHPAQWAKLAEQLLDSHGRVLGGHPQLDPEFTLTTQLQRTLAVYGELVGTG